jgi:hypothetical protein
MNAYQKKVVERLRSGNDTKITSQLRSEKGFCAFGVACDVYDPTAWYLDEKGEWVWGTNTALAPKVILEELGISGSDEDEVYDLNQYDDGFNRVADLIVILNGE